MTPKEVLIQARSLIDHPDKWTQGTSARNKSGHSVSTIDPEAVCFCSLGALIKVVDRLDEDLYLSARNHLVKVMTGLPGLSDSLADYNDSHTWEEVMVGWDTAIATA